MSILHPLKFLTLAQIDLLPLVIAQKPLQRRSMLTIPSLIHQIHNSMPRLTYYS